MLFFLFFFLKLFMMLKSSLDYHLGNTVILEKMFNFHSMGLITTFFDHLRGIFQQLVPTIEVPLKSKTSVVLG